MKRLLFILAVLIFFAGCSENSEKKAQKLINQHLKVTLHDFGSYEGVEFGTLDTIYTIILDDSLFTEYLSKRLVFQKMRNDKREEADIYRSFDKQKYNELVNLVNVYVDSTWHYKQLEDSVKANFKPQFDGWSMKHSFRSNNANGNKVITHKVYSFDKNIVKITESSDYESFYNFNLEESIRTIEKDFLGLNE